MGGGTPSTTTSIQDIPPEFKPAFTALFNSAFGASRTAAGQEGFGTLPPSGGATELSNQIAQFRFDPFAAPGSEFANPFAGAFPQPNQDIFGSGFAAQQPQRGAAPFGGQQIFATEASHIPGHVDLQDQAGAPLGEANLAPGVSLPAPIGSISGGGTAGTPTGTTGGSKGEPQQQAAPTGGAKGTPQQAAPTQAPLRPSAPLAGLTGGGTAGLDQGRLQPTAPLSTTGGAKGQPQQGNFIANEANLSGPTSSLFDTATPDFSQPGGVPITNPVTGQTGTAIASQGAPSTPEQQAAATAANVAQLPATAPPSAPAPTDFARPSDAAATTIQSTTDNTQQQLFDLFGEQNTGFLGNIGVGGQQGANQDFFLNEQISNILEAGQQGVAPIDAAAGATGIGDTSIPLAAGDPIIGQPFGERFTAESSPLEFESLAQNEAVARQLQGIGNPLLNLGSFTAQGGFLDPASNPFLQANIEASLRPITQEFQNSTVPNFNSQAIQSGAFSGSSARDLAFNQLASGFGQQLLDTGTGIAFENFQRERQLQQNAGSLLDQGALLNQLTPALLSQIGLGQRELAQRPLDEALLQFQESINAPFRPLFPLASIIQGGDIGSTFSTTVPTPSGLSGGILGALGGGSAGAGVGGAFGLEGLNLGGATGLGALLGALGGAA